MNLPRIYANSVSNPDRTYRVRPKPDSRDPRRVFINSGPACFTLDRDNAIRLINQIADIIDAMP